MIVRFLLLFGAVSMAAAHTCGGGSAPLARPGQSAAQRSRPPSPASPVIRFEDASDKAGIEFYAQLRLAPVGFAA